MRRYVTWLQIFPCIFSGKYKKIPSMHFYASRHTRHDLLHVHWKAMRNFNAKAAHDWIALQSKIQKDKTSLSHDKNVCYLTPGIFILFLN